MLLDFSDEYFMRQALQEARLALDNDEVPIGAVVVCNNKIISRTHNLTEKLNDVTAHAEMQAFTAATYALGGKYIKDCTLYVTLEPCMMCAGAAFWAQLGKLVFGAKDPKRGYLKFEAMAGSALLHPRCKVVSGIMAADCAALLKEFFKTKRN